MAPRIEAQANRKLRVLLCGYGHLGLALLQGLWECAEDCELVGVFRWSARPASRHCWEPVEGMLQKQVEQYGVRDIVCKGMNSYEFSVLLQELRPDVVLVGSWGEILKKHLIEYPDILLINCHPSKLPAHRGANPYSSVIKAQEQETGVTFHRIVPQIDAGAMLLQRAIPLETEETGASVRDKCMAVAYEMIPELVQRLKAHVIHGEPLTETEQDNAQQSYYPQLKSEDGELNWQDSPAVMCRQMRALFPWMPCYSTLYFGGLLGEVHVMLYDPNFVAVSSEPSNIGVQAGTILSFKNGKLTIAVSEPTQVLEVSTYQMAFGQLSCPVWLSRLLAPLVFRPGKQFF